MLRKTNYTMDVQPIFNQKRQSHVFKHEAPEKILLQSHSCEVLAVRFLGAFLAFTWSVGFLCWLGYFEGSLEISWGILVPLKKILFVCGLFQHPGLCLLLSWLVDASVGYRALRWTPSRQGLVQARGWLEVGSCGHQHFLFPCFWAGSSLCWWALMSALTKFLCAGYKY